MGVVLGVVLARGRAAGGELFFGFWAGKGKGKRQGDSKAQGNKLPMRSRESKRTSILYFRAQSSSQTN
jgi:hypothetical protein